MPNINPEQQWEAHLDMLNGTFNFYMQAQESMGYSREDALDRLRRAWLLEDKEKLAGIAEMGRILQRAR